MNNPPKTLRWLFWDADLSSIDCDRHAPYVIERISEFGDLPDWLWLIDRYGEDRLRNVVGVSRRLSRRSANLWRLILDIPTEEIACLKTSYPPEAINF